jgi:hypothetical protein
MLRFSQFPSAILFSDALVSSLNITSKRERVGYAWEVLNLVFGDDFLRSAYYDYSTFADSVAFRNNSMFDAELDGFRIGSVRYNKSLTFGKHPKKDISKSLQIF